MFYYGSGNPAPWNETMRPAGLPIRDPEYSTRMDHRAKNICSSAMGYHNQGLDSYDPEKEPFFIRSVDPTWLIEPLRKQKLKPVWLGFPNSGQISGEFGKTPTQ